MPLSINVGLSRKASRDYQSTGYSINVTAELDQALLARPEELQAQVAGLYAQAQQALDRQAQEPGPPPDYQGGGDRGRPSPRPARPRGGNGYAGNGNGAYRNGNGHSNGHANGNGRHGGGMTTSQRRAILAIAGRLQVDAQQEAVDIIGAELDTLTVRQASDLIDHLNAMQPATR